MSKKSTHAPHRSLVSYMSHRAATGNKETAAPWKKAKLGEVLPLKYGKARNEQWGIIREETQTYGSNGAFGTYDRALTTKPTLIVGRKGAAGAVHYSENPCWPIDTAFYTEGSAETYLPFFRYLLESLNLGRLDQSTAIPSLSRDVYDSTEVYFPESTEEQRRIVTEIEKQFSRLEEGVAALKRVQANLKRYRAAVLKAACEGQLVENEVRSKKTEGRSLETGEQLLKRILAERRKSWTGCGRYKEPATPDTNNLPKLPEGWTWAGTEELTAGIDNAITIGPFGSNLMVKDYLESGVSLIFVREIRSENFRRADTRYVSPEKAKELATHKVRGGDVVITKMGEPPGDTSIYPEGLPDAIATSDCIKLTPNRVGTSAAFLKYVIRGQPVKTQIERITRGVAQKKMSLGRFRTVAIPLPPLAEQERIVAEVERRLSVIDEWESVVARNLKRAERLRQAVLQKAFKGNLN